MIKEIIVKKLVVDTAVAIADNIHDDNSPVFVNHKHYEAPVQPNFEPEESF